MTERKERANGNRRNPQPPPQQVFMAPSSPTYPPYATFVDVPTQVIYDPNDPNHTTTTATTTTYAYVYPVSPQFSVQYYPSAQAAAAAAAAASGGQVHATPSNTSSNTTSSPPPIDNVRYGSYPGSPILHPHLHYSSPQMHPSSPPFSPTLQYHSPPTHAFVLPPHQQHFPPLHISSPVLTASGSPQHQFVQPLSFDLKKRQEQMDEYAHLHQFHPQNIYVRGLPATETDESFLELCQVYGPISSSKAILDQKTGECKGYGFAMYENQEHCQLAINGLNAAGYQASLARVGQESFSSKLKSLQDETSTNIYISNLPLSMDEDALEELFKPYQTVSNRILRDPQSGLSRGVGFARLVDRLSASAIIDKFNGHSISGSSAPLQVRFADSPAQKRLKNQTSTSKRTIKTLRDNIFPFPIRPMMPITPETMLGIAPSSSTSSSLNGYPRSLQTEPIPQPITDNTNNTKTSMCDDIDSITHTVNQIDLKDKEATGGGLVS